MRSLTFTYTEYSVNFVVPVHPKSMRTKTWCIFLSALALAMPNRLWFREEASLFQISHIQHFKTFIDLSRVETTCAELGLQTRQVTEVLMRQGNTSRNALKAQSQQQKAQHICKSLELLLHDDDDRDGRSFVLAAGIGAITSWAFSEIKQLITGGGDSTSQHLAEHDNRLDHLEGAIYKYSLYLSGLAQRVAMDEEAEVIKRWSQAVWKSVEMMDAFLSKLLRGLDIGRQGRLSTDIFPFESASALKKQIKRLQIPSGVTSTFDIYHLPASLAYNASGIFIVVHVPVSDRPKLNLMSLASSPIQIGEDDVLHKVSGVDDLLIGVSEAHGETRFAELHRAELEQCFRVGQAYFCNHLEIRKVPHLSCLASLAFNKQQEASKLCKWEKVQDRFGVTLLGNGTVEIVSLDDLAVKITCGSDSSNSVVAKGKSALVVDAGCVLASDLFEVFGAPSESFQKGKIVIDLGARIQEKIKASANDSRPTAPPAIAVPVEDREKHWVRWTHRSVSYGTDLILLILVVAVGFVLHRRAMAKTRIIIDLEVERAMKRLLNERAVVTAERRWSRPERASHASYLGSRFSLQQGQYPELFRQSTV